jgi:hypothetical protein
MSSRVPRSGEKGMSLVVVILCIAALVLLGTTALLTTSTDLKISSNYRMSQQALYAAEAGAEYGINRLRAALQVLNGSTSSVVPPTISGFTFITTGTGSILTPSGGVVQKTVTGNFAGLTAYCQKYIITSTALQNNTNTQATVVYELEDQLIPLFQFGIFYQNRLEINPGADMTFTGGRIHSNTAINLRPDGTSTFSVDALVTSAGGIFNQRVDYAANDSHNTSNSTLQIKDGDGVYQTLSRTAGLGGDSGTDPNWRADALASWDGRVKSSDHGIEPINLPLPAAGNPIDILGTGAGSLYEKSGLRITTTDGVTFVGKDKNNAVVTLPAGLVTAKSFWDGREQKTMTTLEVDITKLTGTALTALNNPPAGGEAGILYVSSTAANPAVRLVNGAALPAGGLSVVTNNPLYIKGDYNTANGPAGIYADAATVLSNSWTDAANAISNNHTASNTTVNAAIMAGNKDTVGAQYSGGAENFMRLLEDWSGKTYTYGGSLACLWQSVQATGNWGNSGVYSPPTRNWSYGINVNNLPPGTPRIRNLQRTAWRQVQN